VADVNARRAICRVAHIVVQRTLVAVQDGVISHSGAVAIRACVRACTAHRRMVAWTNALPCIEWLLLRTEQGRAFRIRIA
jgi:hypothetical protein